MKYELFTRKYTLHVDRVYRNAKRNLHFLFPKNPCFLLCVLELDIASVGNILIQELTINM